MSTTAKDIIAALPEELQPIVTEYGWFVAGATFAELQQWAAYLAAGNAQAVYDSMLDKMDIKQLRAEMKRIQIAMMADINAKFNQQIYVQQIVARLFLAALSILQKMLVAAVAI